MTSFYRFIRGILCFFAYLFFNIKKVGFENFPKDGGFILCCNHTSLSDIWLLIALCPRPIQFMAKQELFKNKIFGWIIRKMGAFPVNRKAADKSALVHAQSLVQNGGILGIFPEGTRSVGSPPAKAKPGAAMIAYQTAADILPVCIYRDGKVRPFQRAVVSFGEIIKYNDYSSFLADEKIDKNALKSLSTLIMQKITLLWEKSK